MKQVIATLVIALSLYLPSLQAQQPNSPEATLSINGASSGPFPLAGSALQNSFVDLRISASPQGGLIPFAIAAGRVAPGVGGVLSSGILDLDLLDPNFVVILNGFDMSSPLALLARLGPVNNPEFAASFFLASSSSFPLGLQALVADPSIMGGYRLTAAVDFYSSGPVITSVSPNSGPAGGGNIIIIQGDAFVDPNISVLINGLPAGVLTQTPTMLQVVVPGSATTGPVDVVVNSYGRVATASGGYAYMPGSGVSTVLENFNSTAALDPSVTPTFGSARWNAPSSPGELTGTPISGTPLATFQGNPGSLGTRIQVNMPIGPGTSLPLTTTPFSGLFSPFDNAINNLGTSINPNGGSHIMHLVEAQDLGNLNSSLELVEWGAAGDLIQQASYPDFEMWAGMSSVQAPIDCAFGPSGQLPGMSAIYSINYNLPTGQLPDPLNLNANMSDRGGVLVRNAATFSTPTSIATYFPYPRFDKTFDYIGSGPGAGNLILEMNSEVNPSGGLNLHRFRATAFSPRRRLIGAPKSSGLLSSAANGCTTYDLRFSFVQAVSSAQSNFYDTAVPSGLGAFLGLDLSPAPTSQPAGTRTRLEVQGASALTNPTTAMGPSTAWLTYIDGDPSNTVVNPLVLQNVVNPSAEQLSGNRYFRFRATLKANHITNTLPSYSQLTAVIQQ